MDDHFHKDEFEKFLQQQANNHRMYPNDHVWPSIYKKLHGDKRWPGLTIAAVVILASTILTSIHFLPKPNIFKLENKTNTEGVIASNHPKNSINIPLVNSVPNIDNPVLENNTVQSMHDDTGLDAKTLTKATAPKINTVGEGN